MDPLFLLKLDEDEAYKKYYVGIFRYKVILLNNLLNKIYNKKSKFLKIF